MVGTVLRQHVAMAIVRVHLGNVLNGAPKGGETELSRRHINLWPRVQPKPVAPVQRRRCTLSASATTPPHLRADERPRKGELREQRTPGQGRPGRTSSEAWIAQREAWAGVIRSHGETPGTACMALPRGLLGTSMYLAPSGPTSLRSVVPDRSMRSWSNPSGSHPLGEKISKNKKGPLGLLYFWRSQGDSNPCYRRERPAS